MKERHCKTCGRRATATAATEPVERDVKPENTSHEAVATTAATPPVAPRPSGFRLPLYLRPLPRQGGSPPPPSAPRPFEHVERIETDTTITHRWVSPDGRTITLTGRNRPIGCLSPAWHWEGRIVQRRVVDAAHARRGCPTFRVTETGP